MPANHSRRFAIEAGKITRRLNALIESSTREQWFEGIRWYSEARSIARELSLVHGVSLDTVAGVISALSPRLHWDRNIAYADLVLAGKDAPCLARNIQKARAIIAAGTGEGFFSRETGPKTESFYRNISGDESAVTVDRHILKACGFDPEQGIGTTRYRMIERVIQRLAKRHGVSPAEMQAIIWVIVR